MPDFQINIIDNTTIKGREDQYVTLTVDLIKILESWQASLFSFEWLSPDGTIRNYVDLSHADQQKYDDVLHSLKLQKALERPILGIGVMDNVEIGSRRDVLLTVFSQGHYVMDVHILKSNVDDFKPYQMKR